MEHDKHPGMTQGNMTHETTTHANMPASGGHHMGAHGSYAGHAIPGAFFIIWSFYWAFSIFRLYLTKKGFRSRSFYRWPYKGSPLLEPIIKLIFPLIGSLIELRIGHDTWIHLTKEDGKFDHDAILSFQHTLMYMSFGISGCVDFVGTQIKLPQGTEQAFLGVAFLAESVLMGFHLNSQGYALDYTVHLLLVYLMLASAAACFLELVWDTSVLAATARALVVLLQGTWFIQIGHILFAGIPAWDVADMHGAMFVPVVFCMHVLLAALGLLAMYLGMQWWYQQQHGLPLGAAGPGGGGGPLSVQLREMRNGGGALRSGDSMEDALAEARVLIAKEYRD